VGRPPVADRAGEPAPSPTNVWLRARTLFTMHWMEGALLLGAAVVILGALGIGRFGYPAILPFMRQGLALTNTQMGLLTTGNLSGYLLTSVVAGFFVAHVRPLSLVTLCLLTLAAALALTGWAAGFPWAFAMQTVAGAASGGCVVVALGLVSSSFSRGARGLATGLAISGAGVGLIVSSVLVSLVQAEGQSSAWRQSWFSLGAAVVAATAVSAFLLAASGVADGATATVEAPAENRSAAYRSTFVWHIAFASTFFAFAYVSYSTFYVEFLLRETGLDQNTASHLWSMVGVSSLLSGVAWGWLSDVWGRKPSLGLAFLALGTAIGMAVLSHAFVVLLLSAALFGITVWSTLAIIVAIYADQLPPQQAPAAIGLTMLVFGLGQVGGSFLAGRLADLTGSFRAVFTIASVAAFIGMAIVLLLQLPRGREAD